MKMFSELTLKSIKTKLEKVGVGMTDEQFNALTYSELKKVYKKARKAYNLYAEVDHIINKAKAPTPEVPMPKAEATASPSRNKIIKGA